MLKKMLYCVWRVVRSVIAVTVSGILVYYICVLLNRGTNWIVTRLDRVWEVVKTNTIELVWVIIFLIVGAIIADFVTEKIKKKYGKKKSAGDGDVKQY